MNATQLASNSQLADRIESLALMLESTASEKSQETLRVAQAYRLEDKHHRIRNRCDELHSAMEDAKPGVDLYDMYKDKEFLIGPKGFWRAADEWLLSDKSFVLRILGSTYETGGSIYGPDLVSPSLGDITYGIELYRDDFGVMSAADNKFELASDRLKDDKAFVLGVLQKILDTDVRPKRDKRPTGTRERYERCREVMASASSRLRLDFELGRLARDIYAFERDARFSNDRPFVMEVMAEIETWDFGSKRQFDLPGFLHHNKEAVILAIKVNVENSHIVRDDTRLAEDMDVFRAMLHSGAELGCCVDRASLIFHFHYTRLIHTEAAVCAAALANTEFLAGFPQGVRNDGWLMLEAIKIDSRAMYYVFGGGQGVEIEGEWIPERFVSIGDTLFGDKSFAIAAIHAAPKTAKYIRNAFKNDEDVQAAIRRPFNNRLVACVAHFRVMAGAARERLYDPDRGEFMHRAAKRFRAGDYNDEYTQNVIDGCA